MAAAAHPAAVASVRIVKKTLKGDLMGQTGFKSVKPAKLRKSAADGPENGASDAPPAAPDRPAPAARQVDLDALVKDDIVVITEPLQPRHGRPIPMGSKTPLEAKPPQPAAPASAPAPPAKPPKVESLEWAPLKDGAALPLARAVLAEGLYKDIGEKGSKVQHPTGTTFHIHPKYGDGVVHTQHNVLVPLQEGHRASHMADLAIVLENRALLVADLVASSVSAMEMKALAYDALQMHNLERCFTVLVFVRTPGAGMPQQQAEALGHGYDFAFGIDERDVHSELKFAALRNRIQTWLAAATGKRRL